jgi:putative pyruvate formate lyase activating enzyme
MECEHVETITESGRLSNGCSRKFTSNARTSWGSMLYSRCIAKKGLLLRHLVKPGYESEGQEIMKWIAANVSKDVFVNILEQYHPDAHVSKSERPRRTVPKAVEPGGEAISNETVRYEEINRHVTKEEVSAVRDAAENAGLWRFCDPPGHDGFSM